MSMLADAPSKVQARDWSPVRYGSGEKVVFSAKLQRYVAQIDIDLGPRPSLEYAYGTRPDPASVAALAEYHDELVKKLAKKVEGNDRLTFEMVIFARAKERIHPSDLMIYSSKLDSSHRRVYATISALVTRELRRMRGE